jgi:hypothetical protein
MGKTLWIRGNLEKRKKPKGMEKVSKRKNQERKEVKPGFVQSVYVYLLIFYRKSVGKVWYLCKRLGGKEVKSGFAQSLSLFTFEVLHVPYYFDGFPDDVGMAPFPFHRHSPEDGSCSVY